MCLVYGIGSVVKRSLLCSQVRLLFGGGDREGTGCTWRFLWFLCSLEKGDLFLQNL